MAAKVRLADNMRILHQLESSLPQRVKNHDLRAYSGALEGRGMRACRAFAAHLSTAYLVVTLVGNEQRLARRLHGATPFWSDVLLERPYKAFMTHLIVAAHSLASLHVIASA